MPIYEEKLICPLAVRFTQDHIRQVFRDGRDVEETIKQIKVKPGCGDYDLILEAPFPNIEIIRWYQPSNDGVESDADHWFTLDNRRLYCLQRVAADLWPKRVAAVVELLYAAPNSVKRKDDSLTAGRSVGIGHNGKSIFSHWNWRETCGKVCCSGGHEVLPDSDPAPWACDSCGGVMPTKQRFRCLACDYDLCGQCHGMAPRQMLDADPQEKAACMIVEVDDKKTSTQELLDAPAVPSLLMAALLGHAVPETNKDELRPRATSQDSSTLSTTRSGGSHGQSLGSSEDSNSDREKTVRMQHNRRSHRTKWSKTGSTKQGWSQAHHHAKMWNAAW